MGRKKKKTVLEDVELLIWMLQKEWSCSKEAVWRVEVSPCILKACNKEVERMSRYLHNLGTNSGEYEGNDAGCEVLSLFGAVYATKDAYVLIRVAKKFLAASKEAAGRKRMVVALDDEEYKLVVTRFLEYL